MAKETFTSPREEALQIAYQIRKTILAGKCDPVATLRACLVIATDLGKKSTIEWIERELRGYPTGKLPKYRLINCNIVKGDYQLPDGSMEFGVSFPIHLLVHQYDKNQTLNVTIQEKTETLSSGTVVITSNRLQGILASVGDECFFFLNNIIAELQFGGVVEYLMEEIRRTTDERLATFDEKIAEETKSLYLNLNSTNPADWSKVGHSCRKILKFLADNVFPPSDEKYSAKDGRTLEVNESCFVNRLYAFLDKNTPAEEKKFLGAQLNYLESYLRQVVSYAQMAEHNPSIEKFHANMLAIHTYLVISDILKHVVQKTD